MTLSRILPEFGTRTAQHAVTLTDVSLEEQKLASYESGYQAGWDDSAKANADAGQQVSADFAQNIRDLSMTYQDAYGALLNDIKPMLTQIVDAVLPAMARETLGPRVLELIAAEMQTAPRSALTLFAAADDSTVLQPLVQAQDNSVEVTVETDETLLSGQVRLRFGGAQEQELDTAALIDGIQTALRAFFDNQTEAGPELQTRKETA